MADNNAEHMMMQQGMEQMETDQSDIVSQALRSAQPDQMQMMQEEQQQQMEDDQVVTTSLQFDPSNPNVLYTSDGQLINRSDLSPEEQLLVQQALQQHLAEQEAQDQLQGIDETAAASNGENVENIAGGASGEQINKPADLVQTISDNVRRQQEYVKAQNLLMQASESNKPAELPQGYRYEEKIVIRQGQPHVMKMPVKKARSKALDLPPALQSLMPKVDVGKDGHSVIRIHQSQISPEQLKSLQENPNVRLVFRPPGGKRGGRGGPNRRRGRPKSKPYNVSDRGGPDSPSYNDYPGSRGRRGRGRGSYVGGGYRKTGTEASRMDWLRAQDTYDAEAEATQQRLSYVPPKLSNLSQEEQQISQRRRNRLKEVLNECSPEDVLQATLPHLSRVFSVYEFLVMKVEGDKDQVGRVYFGDVYKEYESLHKYMSNLTPKYFDALRDKRVQKQKEEEQKALKEAQEQEEKVQKALKEAQEKLEKEAQEKAEKEAQEKLEKEAQEKAEKEAQEKSEKEAQEKAQKEAREKAEKEKAEQEAKEKAEKEAKEAGEKEKVEIEVQEKQEAEEVQKPASEAADKVVDKKEAATEEAKAGSEVVMTEATPQEKVDENKTKEAETIEVTMAEAEKPTKDEKSEKTQEEAEVQVKKEEQSSGVPAEKKESEEAKPEEKVEGDKVEAMEVTEEAKEATEEIKTPEDKSKDSEVTKEAKVSEEGKTSEDKPKEPEAVASTEEKDAGKENAEQKQTEEAEHKDDKPAEEKEIKIEEGQESVEKVSEEKSEEEKKPKEAMEKSDEKKEEEKSEDKKEEDEFYHIKSHLLARSLGLEGDVLEDALIVLVEGGDDQNNVNNLQDSNKMNAVSDSGLDTNQLQTQMEGVVSQQQQQIDNSQVTFVTGNQQISSLGESVVTSSQMDSSIVTSQQQVVEQMQVDANQLQVEQQQQVHQKVEEQQQQMQTSEVVQQQQEVDQMGQTIQLDQGQSQIIPASTDGAQIIQIGTGEDRQFIEVPEGYTLIQTANGLVMSQPGTTITQGDDGTIYVTNEDGTTVPLTDANQGNPQQ